MSTLKMGFQVGIACVDRLSQDKYWFTKWRELVINGCIYIATQSKMKIWFPTKLVVSY